MSTYYSLLTTYYLLLTTYLPIIGGALSTKTLLLLPTLPTFYFLLLITTYLLIIGGVLSTTTDQVQVACKPPIVVTFKVKLCAPTDMGSVETVGSAVGSAPCTTLQMASAPSPAEGETQREVLQTALLVSFGTRMLMGHPAGCTRSAPLGPLQASPGKGTMGERMEGALKVVSSK